MYINVYFEISPQKLSIVIFTYCSPLVDIRVNVMYLSKPHIKY